jgi:hypothetical protein
MSSGGMEQEVFMNNSDCLDYSRVEVAVAARPHKRGILDSRFRGNDIKEGSNLSFTSILEVRQQSQPLPISLQTPQFLLAC